MNLACTCNFLDEVYALWVILLLDVLVVGERSMLCRMLPKEETGSIEANRVLFSSDILDLNSVRGVGPIRVSFTRCGVRSNARVRFGTVLRRLEVEQLSSNGVSLRHEGLATKRCLNDCS